MLSIAPPTEYDLWTDPRLGGGVGVMLAAHTFDALNIANWQRTGKNRNRPKPVRIPKTPSATEHYTREDIDNFDSWYVKQAGGQQLH